MPARHRHAVSKVKNYLQEQTYPNRGCWSEIRNNLSYADNDIIDSENISKNPCGNKISADMTSNDRSQEFASIVQGLQERSIARAVNFRTPRQAQKIQSYSNFMMISKNIGRNVASTYAKLEKLALRKIFVNISFVKIVIF